MAGKRSFVRWLLLMAIVASFDRSALANVTVPTSRDYIIDTAHVVTPETRRQLDGWLQELQEKTGAQIKLLTVRSTGGEDFFDFSQRHFQAWQLGQKGKNDGALIVLAVDDHKVRVHTGYGLEGALPDSWCGSASREAASEYFKSGRIDAGLKWLVVAVVRRVADDRQVTLTGLPDIQHAPGPAPNTANNLVAVIVLLLFLAFFFWSNYQNRRRQSRWSRWLGSPWVVGPRSSGWGSFGGSSFGGGSSGGGSFGGGSFGGGSFGGGGSSGGGGGGASW